MFEQLKTRYSVWKKYSRTKAELQGLSDRELDDLGFARGDIAEVARKASR
jgi:uncharacterized protein YjiS (DUF1127 family)